MSEFFIFFIFLHLYGSRVAGSECMLRSRALICKAVFHREIQAQEALQNGQLGSGEGIPDLQPGVLASQAMIEKTLIEDPRWQGETR